VGVDDVLHNGKAKPRSTNGALTVIDTLELLKDFF